MGPTAKPTTTPEAGPKLAKLVSIAGPGLAGPLSAGAGVPEELRPLLALKNGFYAFESALHVFPATPPGGVMDLASWNSPALWRFEYEELAHGLTCFAEDVFGGQFCLSADGVGFFEPETGAVERLGASLEDWAGLLLDDHEVRTGHHLAHAWQVEHGRLPDGQRLAPKTPFVCGGAFALDNLHLVDAAEGMRWRGKLARQIRDLPDGAAIEFTVRG